MPASQYDPAENVTIGRRSGGFYFQGVIDEVRVYGRALTAAEIQADMTTPLGEAGGHGAADGAGAGDGDGGEQQCSGSRAGRRRPTTWG